VHHVNFTRGKNVDCDGHGTHVAGTIAAKADAEGVVGVAPGAPLTGVKVLGCNGSGWTSDVIKGIDWVTKNAKKPAVANLSLGGRTSKALDDAARRSATAGFFYGVSVGNTGVDACTESPARAGGGPDNGIVTVAASGQGDQEAYFGNYGRYVDVWVPGENIASTMVGGGTTTMSGTSMASPHAAGGAALYLSKNPGSRPTAVEGQLKTDAVATGTGSKDGDAIERLFVGRY
jgi:subtilisin family serine protease